MADEQQTRTGAAAFVEQQADEGFAGIGVEGGGRLVSDHQFRLADQRARRRDPLLLADRQGVGAT